MIKEKYKQLYIHRQIVGIYTIDYDYMQMLAEIARSCSKINIASICEG